MFYVFKLSALWTAELEASRLVLVQAAICNRQHHMFSSLDLDELCDNNSYLHGNNTNIIRWIFKAWVQVINPNFKPQLVDYNCECLLSNLHNIEDTLILLLGRTILSDLRRLWLGKKQLSREEVVVILNERDWPKFWIFLRNWHIWWQLVTEFNFNIWFRYIISSTYLNTAHF